MNEQEKKEQTKVLFLCLLMAGITYVAANWITTQMVAERAAYSAQLTGEIGLYNKCCGDTNCIFAAFIFLLEER